MDGDESADGQDKEESRRKRMYDRMASVRWDIAADHEPYRARGQSSPHVKSDLHLKEKNRQVAATTPYSGNSTANDKTKISNAHLSSDRRRENSNSGFDAFKGSSSNSQHFGLR